MRTITCISVVALLAVGVSHGFGKAPSELVGKGKSSVEPAVLARATMSLKKGKVVAGNPTLTPRAPYIKEANLDMYLAGRWDTTGNYTSCSAHVVGGTGDWNGTVGYIRFDPPTTGTYIVVTRFTGNKKTCHMEGPWGEASATTQVMGDPGEVVGMFTSRSGDPVDISFWFTIPAGQGGIGAKWFATEFIKFAP